MTSRTPSVRAAPVTEQTHLQLIPRLQALIDQVLAPDLPALRAGSCAPIDLHDHGDAGDSAIIQFPQQNCNDEPACIATAMRNLKAAKSLRRRLRDQENHVLATKSFGCEIMLCSDIAFTLAPRQRIGKPDLDVLLLMRTDKKVMGDASQDSPIDREQDDCPQDVPDLYCDLLRNSRIRAVLSLSPARVSRIARRNYNYNQLADWQLSHARFTITDRLHAHILSTLLALPHCFFDNHYGKITRFSATFSTRWFDSYQAKTLPEAGASVRAWLEAPENFYG